MTGGLLGAHRRRRRRHRRAARRAPCRRHPSLGTARPRPRDARRRSTPARPPPPSPTPLARRRFNELLVTLELCRHPETPAQVERVEEYAEAMEVGGPHLQIVRTWIDEGAERATADFDRFYARGSPRALRARRCATASSTSTNPTSSWPRRSRPCTTNPRAPSAGPTSSSTGATTSPCRAPTRTCPRTTSATT